jgi:hypothetical protein
MQCRRSAAAAAVAQPQQHWPALSHLTTSALTWTGAQASGKKKGGTGFTQAAMLHLKDVTGVTQAAMLQLKGVTGVMQAATLQLNPAKKGHSQHKQTSGPRGLAAAAAAAAAGGVEMIVSCFTLKSCSSAAHSVRI